MATMAGEEWQAWYVGLDTVSLLAAGDAVDVLRTELSDGDYGCPSEICDDMHRLTMATVCVTWLLSLYL